MKIRACIKDLNQKFTFDSPSLVEEISKHCPILKELFQEKTFLGGAVKYRIRFNDYNKKRLQELMSQIDKYRVKNGIRDYDFLKQDYIWNFRRLAHNSIMKKKSIDVLCYK